MKSRKRLGSEHIMKIDGFVDGNAISDLNLELPRKQAGAYQAGTAGTRRGPTRGAGPRRPALDRLVRTPIAS